MLLEGKMKSKGIAKCPSPQLKSFPVGFVFVFVCYGNLGRTLSQTGVCKLATNTAQLM